jgi:hypothetical protein
MSKYKSQGVGQNKRSTNMFYRSGISSLLSRLEKLENEVFCNSCVSPVIALDGTQAVSRTYNHGTVIWTGDADNEVLTLWPGQVGDTLTIVLAADTHGSGGSVTVANSDGYFWGLVTVRDTNADNVVASQNIVEATASATPGSYDFLQLEDDATDTGGSAGDVIRLVCTKKDGWHVHADLGTTGTPTSIATITSVAG